MNFNLYNTHQTAQKNYFPKYISIKPKMSNNLSNNTHIIIMHEENEFHLYNSIKMTKIALKTSYKNERELLITNEAKNIKKILEDK